MPQAKPSLADLFETLNARLCDLDDAEQSVAITLYRELLNGAAVEDNQVAEALGWDPARVAALLQTPALESLIHRNDKGSIIGFAGMAVVPMKHRFRVDGHTLYTWCAWDALFLVDALDVRATVESSCPETGATVRLTVSRDGVSGVDPAGAVMSFLVPDAPLFEQTSGETMSNFCHYIHFLASPDAAVAWTERHEGTFVLSLDEGFELGRRQNNVRFNAVLERSRP